MAWFGSSTSQGPAADVAVEDVQELQGQVPLKPAAPAQNSGDALNSFLADTLGEDSTVVKIMSSNPYFAAVS